MKTTAEKKEKILFECPHCGLKGKVDKSFEGKKARCKCGKVIVVKGAAVAEEKIKPDMHEEENPAEKRSDLDRRVENKPIPFPDRRSAGDRRIKKCPHCGKDILVAVSKCNHCGEFLVQPSPQKEPIINKKSEKTPSSHKLSKNKMLLCIIGVCFFLTVGAFVYFVIAPGFFSETDRISVDDGKGVDSNRTNRGAIDDGSSTNSIGMEFVRIPAGSFRMSDHQVTLTKDFYMMTTEVTQGQWRAVMGTNPSYFGNCGDNCPVEQVSWEDVEAFLLKLRRKEGNNNYRLPTEAEWMYACHGGETSETYCGGSDPDPVAWYKDNSVGKTHPVGKKKPNGFGLYDMGGNVSEWCRDWHSTYPSGEAHDPAGPADGSDRVLRGGSFHLSAWFCRSSFRNSFAPGRRSFDLGFRLARSTGP